ncbi:MAG: hypothetical protein AAF525_19190, partial [Pseudomonadota bacterium]
MMRNHGRGLGMRLLAIALVGLLAGCTGTTAMVQQSDIDVDPRPVAITPYSLGNVSTSSSVSEFSSTTERG